MVRAPFALAVLALLVVGCLGAPGSPTPPTPGAGAWTLDCSLGAVEQARDAAWAQTCVARGSHTPRTKAEMWIAVNPTDVSNVVVGSKDRDPALSNQCVWAGLAVTHDAGRSWHDVSIGGKFADRKPGDPLYGYSCATDPDFQFTKDGALHYAVEMYNAANTGPCNPAPVGCGAEAGYKIMLATSRDGGDTWPSIITFQPDLLVVTDYSRMTIVPTTQTILESIGSDGGQRCHVLSSRDGGKTADPPVEVVTTGGAAPCNSGGSGAIAASPKGVAVILGRLRAGGTLVARSTDDGRTWLDGNTAFTFKPIAGQFAESKYRITNNLEVAYDLTSGPRAGTLYATYASAERDESDVYVRSSPDDGRTWSDAALVNDDPAGSHQWMSNVAVAGDGSVHVFFMDKRYDPAHILIDITHAVSLDGGKTWRNERVTTKGFDGDLGVHQEGAPFIGDYIGVACVKDDCWVGFPDASLGEEPSIAAAHVHRA